MRKLIIFLVIGLTAAVLFLAAGRYRLMRVPYAPRPFSLEEPAGFVRMSIPADNPLTHEGIALGRRLFYDPVLSADSSISCATCHLPELSFSDGKRVSRGLEGSGLRNAPSLINVGYYYTGLFWDGRAASLEDQALHPVRNPLEMGAGWEAAEERLRRHEDYPRLFREAFGIRRPAQIDRLLVARALAQFERTLISADAKFDRVQRGEVAFSPAERRGWEIFFDFPGGLSMAECGHCHADPLFTSLEYFNNGLEPRYPGQEQDDPGRAAVTGRNSDKAKFRTPSLRNVALTAPYMHDGRFETLEEVIDHYASGGHYAGNVNPNVRPLRLSDRDKADLLAFLGTLTDSSFVTNEGFQNPFHP